MFLSWFDSLSFHFHLPGLESRIATAPFLVLFGDIMTNSVTGCVTEVGLPHHRYVSVYHRRDLGDGKNLKLFKTSLLCMIMDYIQWHFCVTSDSWASRLPEITMSRVRTCTNGALSNLWWCIEQILKQTCHTVCLYLPSIQILVLFWSVSSTDCKRSCLIINLCAPLNHVWKTKMYGFMINKTSCDIRRAEKVRYPLQLHRVQEFFLVHITPHFFGAIMAKFVKYRRRENARDL